MKFGSSIIGGLIKPPTGSIGGNITTSSKSGPPAPPSLLPGIKAYYSFTSLTTDQTGNGNTLTNNNAVSQIAGIIGQAANFTFNLAGRYFTGTSIGGASQVSVSFWIQSQGSSSTGVWGDYGATNTGYAIGAFVTSTTVQFQWSCSAGNGTTNATFPSTSYVHCVMVYDGTQTTNASRLKIYVNGSSTALTYTGTIPATLGYAGAFLSIGGENSINQEFLVGSLDEYGIWNAALSQAQVNVLYNGGIGVTWPLT